ncbi:hypothetical protein OPQ81_007311 [Rhizoctonia solani]|nr:hypothetical protein OPQ81_007311 [Rhizoctonia solani]
MWSLDLAPKCVGIGNQGSGSSDQFQLVRWWLGSKSRLALSLQLQPEHKSRGVGPNKALRRNFAAKDKWGRNLCIWPAGRLRCSSLLAEALANGLQRGELLAIVQVYSSKS